MGGSINVAYIRWREILLRDTMNVPPSSLFCKGGLSEEILPFKRKSYKAILFASQPSIISLVILRMAQQ